MVDVLRGPTARRHGDSLAAGCTDSAPVVGATRGELPERAGAGRGDELAHGPDLPPREIAAGGGAVVAFPTTG